MRVKVFLKRVSYCVLPVAGLGALLVKFPSLHNGLVPCEKRDWYASSSELNKRCQLGKDEWKPVKRLYPTLDFTTQKTHKLSSDEIQKQHFTHVYKTIQDEQVADRLSRYIAKFDADDTPQSENDGSEVAYFDGTYRAFLSQLKDTLADPVRFYSTVFGPLLNVPNTEHYVSELKGLRIHYSITDFAKDKAKQSDGKPKVGVLLLNGWPSNANEWASLLQTIEKSDRLKDCSVSPVFVTASLPNMGTNLSEVAQRKEFGDFNLYSVAMLMRQLMEETLSNEFDQYIVLGTDWGSITTEVMCMSEGNSVTKSPSIDERKFRAALIANPIANPPLLELILMQRNIKWVDRFLKNEPESVKELYRKRDSDGPLSSFGRLNWELTWYQHWMNTRPHVATNVLNTNLVAYSAYIFETYVRWSSMLTEAMNEETKKAMFNQIISTAVMAYTNPGGIEGGVSYYRENIIHGYLSLLLTKTPEHLPVYASVHGVDPLSGRTCDRCMLMRYPGLKKSHYHPTVGHFPSIEAPEGLMDDLFDTLEDVNNNLLIQQPKSLI